MTKVSPCQIVTVITFFGSRSRAFLTPFLKSLDDDKNGYGPGPSPLDCLFYAGHTGASLDGGKTVFAFNPDVGNLRPWKVVDRLKRGDAFPGLVRDDTTAFVVARQRTLAVRSFNILLPDTAFQRFEDAMEEERKRSRFTYGYPDGNGDCNCTTWLERIGLPLLRGA